MPTGITMLFIIAIVAVAAISAADSCADAHAGELSTWPQVLAWIEHYAGLEGVPAGYLVAVAECEAAGDPYAVGAQGEAGPFQWHPRGLWLETPAGREGLSPWDLRLNVAMAVWAFARGYGHHWSCA